MSEGLKCLKKNKGMLDASHQDSVGVILADAIRVKASVKALLTSTAFIFPTPQKGDAAARRKRRDHSGDAGQN